MILNDDPPETTAKLLVEDNDGTSIAGTFTISLEVLRTDTAEGVVFVVLFVNGKRVGEATDIHGFELGVDSIGIEVIRSSGRVWFDNLSVVKL